MATTTTNDGNEKKEAESEKKPNDLIMVVVTVVVVVLMMMKFIRTKTYILLYSYIRNGIELKLIFFSEGKFKSTHSIG